MFILLSVLCLSDASHKMSAQVAEAGENQGLLVDGRRADQEPRTTQATRRETRGHYVHYFLSVACLFFNRKKSIAAALSDLG